MDLDLADVGVGVKLYHAPLTDCRGRGVVPGRRVAAAHFTALDLRLAAARDAAYDAAVRSAASGLEAVHCEFGRDAVRQMATATPATVAAADVEPPPRVLRGPVLHCSDRADARTGTVADSVRDAVRPRKRWSRDGYRADETAAAVAADSTSAPVADVPYGPPCADGSEPMDGIVLAAVLPAADRAAEAAAWAAAAADRAAKRAAIIAARAGR